METTSKVLNKKYLNDNYLIRLIVFLPTLLFFVVCLHILWTALFFPTRWSYWKQTGQIILAQQAAQLRFHSVARIFLYRALSQRLPTLDVKPWEMLLDTQVTEFLAIIQPSKDFEPTSATLAVRMYSWGLGYYPEYPHLTEQWWLAAQAAAPQWSYYYLELALLYRDWGDESAAFRMMDSCLANAQAAPHCQSVYPSFMSGEFEVGWFRTEIDE